MVGRGRKREIGGIGSRSAGRAEWYSSVIEEAVGGGM